MVLKIARSRRQLRRLQTSKFSMTSFYVTSFICEVHAGPLKPSFHKVVSCRYLSFGVLGVILKDRKRPSETENDSVAGIEQILSQRHKTTGNDTILPIMLIGLSRLLQGPRKTGNDS